MNSKGKKSTGIDSVKQLELLKLQCNKLAPNLYRTYALYLQILRSLTLNSVRNSILNLIAGQEYSYSGSTISEKSKACQIMVDKLVNRCNSLLTIEHILDLTRQMERENKLILDEARDQISSTFNKDKRIKTVTGI